MTRRIRALELADTTAYRDHLGRHPEEWSTLRELCRVTISRFYRDRGVFHSLEIDVLPRLAELAQNRERSDLAVWCAGCAGGEEVYTLSLIWQLKVTRVVGGVRMRVVATDIDTEELESARIGAYPAGALRELPRELFEAGFDRVNGLFRIRDRFREGIEFRRSDLTEELPEGPFDLVLCRNLAFTYFDESLQRETAQRLTSRMASGGVLVVGKHEAVGELGGLVPTSVHDGIYTWIPPDS